MNLLLIVLFSFLAAMSLIIVMFFVPMAVQNSPQARIKRRLTTIGRAGHASRADVQNLLKSSLYSDVPWVNALLSRMQIAKPLDLLLERANVDMTLGLFILCSVVAGRCCHFSFFDRGSASLLGARCGIDRARMPLLLSQVYYVEANETFLGTAAGWLGHDEPESAGGIGLNPGDGFCG